MGRVLKRKQLNEESWYLSKGCSSIFDIIVFGASQFKRAMEQLEEVQQRVTKVVGS